MLTLPDAIVALLFPFAMLFTSPTWRKAQLLLVGTILTPGPAHRGRAAARHGTDRPPELRPVPRGVQSGGVVVPRGGPSAFGGRVLLLQHLDRGDGPFIFGVRSLM